MLRPLPTPVHPQTLFLFSSALHASVYVVLCWTSVVPHLMAAAARALALRRAPPPLPVVTGLAAGSLAIGEPCPAACRPVR